MSREGKLLRGKAYFDMRNIKGEMPSGVVDNESKMADLNFYLDSLEKDEKTSVDEEAPKKKKWGK